MQAITYHEVRVKFYALETKDVDFDKIITEGVKYELQVPIV